MATTTTNFGWDIPQSTDLVKDGATAIAALGQDIDTSMVDLKGGTTGQVLSKASNTDMDFSWVAPTSGDITGVTAGTGISGGGTSGDVTVSFDIANYGGGQYSAGKNKIINGDFGINQRNVTSTTTNDAFIHDRWSMIGVGGTTTTTSESFTLGSAPVTGYEGNKYIKQAITGQTTQSQYSAIRQKIEDVRTFANQTVTLSFWAKADSGTPYLWVEYQQYFGTGGSPSATPVAQLGSTITLSTSWTRYSVTGTIASISGKTIGTNNDSALQILLWTSLGSSIRAYTGATYQNTNISVWGVQIEAGSTATPFQTATGTKQAELAACQRYYVRYDAATQYQTFGLAVASSTTAAYVTLPLPVQMRVVPTAIDASTAGTFRLQNNQNYELSTIALGTVGNGNKAGCLSVGVASGLTAGNFYILIADSDTTAYLGFTAEL